MPTSASGRAPAPPVTLLVRISLACLLLASCGGGGGGASNPPAVSCGGIAARTFVGAHVQSAGEASVGGTTACVVNGYVDPAIKFQLTIPCDWNGKLLYLGSGGFGGSISAATDTWSPNQLGDVACDGKNAGYAIVASDLGHEGTGASFVLDTPAAVDDYAFRATHVVQAAAREIIQLYKSSAVAKAYFEGCSDGGREGLIEAQRYPEDFDGIIARAPAANLTGLQTTGNAIARRLLVNGALASPTKLALLGNAQLNACDALDGLADGIISVPDACAAVIDTLRCMAGDAPDCLTDEEIATFKVDRSPTPLPYVQVDGITEYPGYPPGYENEFLSWPLWLLDGVPFATPPQPPLKPEIQNRFFRYFIIGDPAIDPLQITLSGYAVQLERESRRSDATNPNLAPFFARGGKLILWHGLADQAISANGTRAYYENVRTAVGTQADQNMSYYTAPGVMHCRSGPGADSVDLVSPLASWVEAGVVPGVLVAFKYPVNPDGSSNYLLPPILSRPMCPNPQYPQYNGAGDVNDAASFTCRIP
jgi:pimeloyl-ACP methyl ester carboxylesterase